MTKLKQIYKCNVCGNIIELVHAGAGELVCCGQPMELMIEKIKDEGMEKHVPVIEKVKNGYKIKVGAQAHPMEENHYIEWIELMVGDRYCRKFLQPGDTPEAIFDLEGSEVSARIYCNVHGLWKSAE